MTLQQLKYVAAVADTRNITEAAKRVFISQPSLTAAIHELENEINSYLQPFEQGGDNHQRGRRVLVVCEAGVGAGGFA